MENQVLNLLKSIEIGQIIEKILIIKGDSLIVDLRKFCLDNNIGYVNVGVELSTNLLILGNEDRKLEVFNILRKVIREAHNPVLLLDRIQVLFEPSLDIRIDRLFRQLGQNNVLIVRWPDEYLRGNAEKIMESTTPYIIGPRSEQ